MTPEKIVPIKTPKADPFSPESLARAQRERQERQWKSDQRFNRLTLFGLLAVPLYGVLAWLTARSYPALALAVFVILPFSGLVLHLVWKGWLEKPPSSDGS